MYLLGYDIGSSSIKAALVEASTRRTLAVVQSPDSEMAIASPQPGFAEQDPDSWWEHVCKATQKLLASTGVDAREIQGIGISYQMHGLVCVDENGRPLRPAIIWCDSRAVGIGQAAFDVIGHDTCLRHLLNSPGNFTAAKLAWVKHHEPAIYEKTRHFLLPGDYIALCLTGEAMTTASGLSEGIFWDFVHDRPADLVFDHFGFDKKLIPAIAPTFSRQGNTTAEAALATGLRPGIPVAYRAGDQPNNALSLNVLQPGEVAATGGTSGVVYAVLDKPSYDPPSRVNGFAHVNHLPADPRIGILLCINGAGSMYNWARQNLATGLGYGEMEALAAQVPIGSDGLRVLPFGNGAERMLGNRDIGARFAGLQFNRHARPHLVRAALEGIAFSFVYGTRILASMGLDLQVMRVGNDNLFRSAIFANTISSLVGAQIEVVESTGAVGAAKAAGVATGLFGSVEEAMAGTQCLFTYAPAALSAHYIDAYNAWEHDLLATLA